MNFGVIGLDLGYGHVKAVCGENKKEIFPSVAQELRGDGISSDISSDNFDINKMVINYEEKDYAVGEYAVKIHARGGKKNFNNFKLDEPSEIVKILSSVSLFSQDAENTIELLVVGLNIENYNKYKDEAIRLLKDKNFEYKIGNKLYSLKIDDVKCIPQGVGSYYDQLLDFKGEIKNEELLNAKYALIDVGERTVDGFIAEGIDIIPGTATGENYGISDAYKRVAQSLKLNNIPYNIIENAYLQGKKLIWKGSKHSIDILCKQEFERLTEDIYEFLHHSWDKQLDTTEYLQLAGGGVKLIGNQLTESFGLQSKETDDPQFSNARGYYKLGMYSKEA